MKAPNLRSLTRLALAFAVSPLVTALLTGAWMLIGPDAPGWRTPSMIAWDTIAFSYLAVVLIGLPLTALFSVLRLKLWWQYALTGLVMGTTLMVVSYQIIPVSDTPLGDGDYYQPVDWGRSLAFGFIAATTALAFWWLRYGDFGRKREISDTES